VLLRLRKVSNPLYLIELAMNKDQDAMTMGGMQAGMNMNQKGWDAMHDLIAWMGGVSVQADSEVCLTKPVSVECEVLRVDLERKPEVDKTGASTRGSSRDCGDSAGCRSDAHHRDRRRRQPEKPNTGPPSTAYPDLRSYRRLYDCRRSSRRRQPTNSCTSCHDGI